MGGKNKISATLSTEECSVKDKEYFGEVREGILVERQGMSVNILEVPVVKWENAIGMRPSPRESFEYLITSTSLLHAKQKPFSPLPVMSIIINRYDR